MSINELELELEILEMAYDIFKGTAVGEVITFSDPIKDAKKAYGERIRDLKNEIFERSVLVQS